MLIIPNRENSCPSLQVEVMLQLDEIRNTVIGELGKGGLKLAHRKRVGIAMELVANPSVLLLDVSFFHRLMKGYAAPYDCRSM